MFVFSSILLAQVDESANIFAEITIEKIIVGIFVLVLALILLKLSENLNNVFSEKVPRRFRLIVRQSLPFSRGLIIVMTLITLMGLFLDLTGNNLLVLTGTISVALGFAFKDYASSLIAGVVALFEVPYRVGDRVQVGDHYGEIISYGLRYIRLRTPTDNIVTIPHNKIWTEAISNSNDGALEAQVDTDFYFAHNVNVELVMKILYQAAYTSQYTQLKLPIVVVMEESTWATHLILKCYPMDARDEAVYKTDLLKRSKQALAKYGITYPSRYSHVESD